MWKDFFSFTKKERQGIFILIALLGGICIGKFIFLKKESIIEKDTIVQGQIFEKQKEDKISQVKDSFNYQPNKETIVIMKPFDPNVADSVTLVSLGLKSYIAKNIIKYRDKGGKFRNPDDLAKIYGLSNADFVRLKPYIRIKEEKGIVKSQGIITKDSSNKISYPQKQSIQIPKQEKISLGTVLDINNADTTMLKTIPNIGTSFALRIVKYREILGGFYTIEQLKEVYGIDDDLFLKISPYVCVAENLTIQLIAVNQNSLDQLRAHPYLNFYQAKVIIELRKKKGKVNDLSELAMFEEFTEKDLYRLKFYLSFE